MKKSMARIAALVAAFASGTAGAQPAPNGVQMGADGAPKCLTIYYIEGSTTLDARTIVFRMKDGSAWKNTLQTSCAGLKFHGFEYLTSDQQLCSNMHSIRVLETRQTCALGNFAPYTPAGQHQAP